MTYRRAVDALRIELGELLEAQEQVRDLSAYRAYDGRPVAFLREILKFEPWSRQEDIAETLERHPLVAVVGANAVGKDAMVAHLALYWTLTKGGTALIVSPTERQNVQILMREIRGAWHRVEGGLPGRLLTHAYDPGEGQAGGILAMTSTSVGRLTGFHGEKVLMILSEAQELEPFVLEAALACATGPADRIVMSGNPLYPSGDFHRAAQPGSGWAVVTIPAAEHPNVVQGRTIIPGGPSPEGVERIRAQYGEDSNTFRSRVLSEFPTQDAEGLLDREWIDQAVKRHGAGIPPGPRSGEEVEPQAGLDVARYGSDGNCLIIRHGPRVLHLERWGGLGLLNTARKVEQVVQRFGIRPKPCAPALPPARGRIVVDVVGLGAGVGEKLRELGFHVDEHNGGKFSEGGRFLNARAEAFWRLRELLGPDGGTISLPRDERLIEELLALRWREGSGGRVQIGEKAEIKARIGRSPDSADALAMAFVEGPGRPRHFTWRV